MHANKDNLSKRVIGCAFAVSNGLGSGFLEGVYHNALALEFEYRELAFESRKPLKVCYRQAVVGEFVADFVVEEQLILEIKALSSFCREHEAQLLNYLKAGGMHAGLLLNFGTPRIGVKRMAAGHDDGIPL